MLHSAAPGLRSHASDPGRARPPGIAGTGHRRDPGTSVQSLHPHLATDEDVAGLTPYTLVALS